MQTLLGFDYGKFRIGIAVGQDITATATALCTLNCRDGEPDWDKISSLIAEWSPGSLIVGLPLHADGSDSETTRAARNFARELEARYRLPVYGMDERLSSHAAKELQRDGPGKDRSGIDAIAARIILQNWLDTTRNA
ncbi:MAG TPA: Holliday junction resolvase RuvX [Gammaproteobacteria bacterium]|nr:Holliday junction resolvase RuvX [Gammaproteobacteria bacterium]